MPERSQDAFETLNPTNQSISVEELRARTNSINKKPLPSINHFLVAAESNFWPSPSTSASNRNRKESRKVSCSDFDSCITAPETNYGYKREISHR